MSEAERIAELADRVEALTGPDREVDRDIMLVAVPCDRAPFRYWTPMNENTGHGATSVEAVYYGPHCAQVAPVPGLTASLDSARALIPEGWWLYAVDGSIGGRFYVSLRGPVMPCNDPDGEGIIAVPAMASGCGKLLETALTAAALRARNVLLSSLKGEG